MCTLHNSTALILPVCREVSLVPTDVKITPAAVVDEFSYVTEQITQLLQSHDLKVIIELCETIMASDHDHGIKLFSDDQIKQLNHYRNTCLILQELGYLWSWSNHSVLRVLAEFCGEAIKLLDEFDCHLDCLHPITSYPVFELIPTDATSQTTLSVKFAKGLATITLQDVFDMCSLVVNHCGVTQYCLQLIATQQAKGFVTIYWTIPKCVVNLINSTVLQHSSKFYDLGVLEVAIYPDIKIITGNIAKPKVSVVFYCNKLLHELHICITISLFKFMLYVYTSYTVQNSGMNQHCMHIVVILKSRRAVVSRKAKKKQHVYASSGQCDHYSELFTRMDGLNF